MYRLTYDGQIVHDPRTERVCTTLTADMETSTAGTLTFEVAPTHPLYGTFRAMSAEHEVRLWQDDVEVFRGRVTGDGQDMQTRSKLTCQGQLGYLNDTVVRPYGTYADTDTPPKWSTIVDGTVHGYLSWMIEQHNDACMSDAKRFVLGKCESVASITRSSTEWPTTGAEMKAKLVDELGCTLHVSSDGDARVIDLLDGGGSDASQRIEFGVNLLDFASTRDASTVITDIIPRGKPSEGDEFGIDSLADGDIGDGCYKRGDHVWSIEGMRKHGIVTEKRDYDASDATSLLSQACSDLSTSHVVVESIEISAVDLSLVDPTVRPLMLDEWVRVTSKPHGVDQWMTVSKISLDALDPTQTKYTLGATLPSLTHDSALRLSRTRQVAEQAVQDAAAISSTAKAAATKATEAKATADTAQATAATADTTANLASALAATKRRVFTSQPTPPYDVGDLWVTDGIVYYCTTAKEA